MGEVERVPLDSLAKSSAVEPCALRGPAPAPS